MVALLALGFRLVWAFLTPAWMAPDEPAHFTYAMHLVEEGEVPHPAPYTGEAPDQAHEVVQSFSTLLFYRLSRKGGPRRAELVYLPVRHDYRELRSFGGAGEARKTAAGSTATPYPPLYYAIVGLGYRLTYDAPLLSRLHAVRAMSGLLSALSCCFGYLFALELMKDRAWARAVGSAMAMLPMYAFISASVNNDAGMVLAATALCWFWARAFAGGTLTVGVALGLGMTSGLAMLSKPSATPLVMIAGVTALLSAFGPSREAWRVRLGPFLCFCSAFAAVYGPWLVYRLSASFGPPDAYSQEGDVLSGLLQPKFSFLDYLIHQFGRGWPYLRKVFIELGWGHFGWVELPLPPLVCDVITGLYAASALGLTLMVHRGIHRELLLRMAIFCGAQVIFVFAFADYLISFAKFGEPLFVQGRYFYPAIAPFFLMFFLGLHELFGRKRWLILAMPIGMLTLQVFSLCLAIERWYGVGMG
jgi:hypothetical protein